MFSIGAFRLQFRHIFTEDFVKIGGVWIPPAIVQELYLRMASLAKVAQEMMNSFIRHMDGNGWQGRKYEDWFEHGIGRLLEGCFQ